MMVTQERTACGKGCRMEEKYAKLMQIVQNEHPSAAHNSDHVMRVYNLCMRLAEGQLDVNLDILKTATILHDIARVKEDQDDSGTTDHAMLGAKIAEGILRDLHFSEEAVGDIKHCIVAHRFRSGIRPESKEAKILFDADKLDIIGAIGIARSFMIAGEYNERIYSDTPIDEYIKDNLVGEKSNGRIKDISRHAPNIEFETKFKHIPSRLYTVRAKEIAEGRLEFMSKFLERLGMEIAGEV